MTHVGWFRRSVRSTVSLAVWMTVLIVLANADARAETEETADAANTWYATTVVSGRSGYRSTNYWSKGPALRSQTVLGIHPVVTIVRGDRYWVYDVLENEGIEIKRSPTAMRDDSKRLRPFGNELENVVRSNGERVETGRLGDMDTETWRVTTTAGRRTVWVTATDPKIPLRVETFDRENSETITLDYANWASGIEIPEAFFVPPKGLDLKKFEYADYVSKSLDGPVSGLPIMYPDLLHGVRSR